MFATALLTAVYMTRQVIMTFFGTAQWGSHADDASCRGVVDRSADEHDEAAAADATTPIDAHDGHGAHGDFKPHESPPIMLIPLVVLGGLAVVTGLMQLPHLGFVPDGFEHRLEAWLEPVVAVRRGRHPRHVGRRPPRRCCCSPRSPARSSAS